MAREKLMGSLLAAFDQRSWVTISNILVRITFGLGFGQVHSLPLCWTWFVARIIIVTDPRK